MEHIHYCKVCLESYDCEERFSCGDLRCDRCKDLIRNLQPAAASLIEILLTRIEKLEGRDDE